MKEANEVIEEELPIAEHIMDSPRTESDRRMRTSVVMDFDQDDPDERAAFKVFKRCDASDTADFLRIMNSMDGTEGNTLRIRAGKGENTVEPII
eukprot:14224925-Heterocapsa_arctica.AAC.1